MAAPEAILKELDELIRLAEAVIPANPASPDNEKLEKQYAEIMSEYFRQLEHGFPYQQLSDIYNKHVKVEEAMPAVTLTGDEDDFIDPLLKMFRTRLLADLTGKHVLVYLTGSAEVITWGVTKGGIPIAYEGPPIQQAIKYAREHCSKLILNIDEETKKLIASVISDGIENKRGIDGLARDIRNLFDDMSKARAQVIARTETCDALEQAFMDRADTMGITGKEWIVTDPCEICAANEAVGVIPIGDPFPSGDDRPPAHPNCLLPGNKVLPLGIVVMTRAYYSGKAIEIHTRGGNWLAITVNHPILTPDGFVAADRLNEGDYIISSINSEGMVSSINPDYDNVPTAIEDIWESLILSSGMAMSSMKVAPVDFHGDARFFNDDVNIVFTDRFLRRYIRESPLPEHICQDKFSLRDSELLGFSGLRPLFAFGIRLNSTLSGDVSSRRACLPLNRRQFAHHNKSCLASCSRGDTCPQKSSPDAIPVNTIPFTKGQFGFSHQIPTHNFGIRDRTIKSTLALNTMLSENAVKSGLAYAELADKFISRFARFITADEIVDIRNFFFSGHVYNLQSLEQLYIGNNIIVKNCRCALAPSMLRKE